MKKLKDCYVWCEDGSFNNNGNVINYTSWYLNVKGVDIKVKLNKDQLQIINQQKNFFEFDDIDGIEVE